MDGKEGETMRRAGTILLLLLPMMLQARHLFELGLHGGLAGYDAQPVYVSTQVGWHGGAHLYYDYLSPYVVGLRTGVTIDGLQAGFGKLNYEDAYSTIDVEEQQMDIAYTIGNLRERYTTWSVGVPLQLALTRNRFLFLAGAKAVFPLTNSWKQTVEHAALSVYYPEYDNKVEESFPLAASRDFSMTQTGKIHLPTVQWWLALELSYVLPVQQKKTHHSYLVFGAYFDYCFSKITPSNNLAESLIMLTDTRDGFPLHRLLIPVMEGNRHGRKLVSDCTLFDVGIKISYALSPYDPRSRRSYNCHCDVF